MSKDRRLGRGLAALLGEPLAEGSQPATGEFGVLADEPRVDAEQ